MQCVPADRAEAARHGGRDVLAAALVDSRTRTLALLDAWNAALGETLTIEQSLQLNPPRWEAGHIGWFQDYWIARNRQRTQGVGCDPHHERDHGRLAQADILFDSSNVAHGSRWQLDLPDLDGTRAYLAQGLAETLALLADTPETDDALYFFRLVLFHEDMHGEAGIYMAQAQDVALPESMLTPAFPVPPADAIAIPEGRWPIGWTGDGFAFDNEIPAHEHAAAAFEIDSEVVSWRHYLAFIEATGTALPRYIRRSSGLWQRRVFGHWQNLPLDAPATHLTLAEAEAWCQWAGRRLPTEAEWEIAATQRADFHWGQVWEWTASRFERYPGFVPHPYRDYSDPWFGDRIVLRGASRASSPRMAHPRYRNFFTPDRNDVPTGFRSCAR